MEKLTYIFFAISLLFFSCKAMDYSYYREGDNFVCLQYYNIKENDYLVATNLKSLHGQKSQSYEIINDTLLINLFVDENEPFYITTKPDTLQGSCNKNSKIIITSVSIRNYRQSYLSSISPNSFYQVVFPMLEVEGVEKKDMAKWYKSFYAIKAVIKTQTREFVCYYYNPRFFISASNYTRP